MHFVTGGAFNGKSKWVKAFYHLENVSHNWISTYHEMPVPLEVAEKDSLFQQDVKGADYLILEGIELWVKGISDKYDTEVTREKWRNVLDNWKSWEQAAPRRSVILIGTDITKGIVPIDAGDRKWRDDAGRAFQDTAERCDRVDLIWYRLNTKLK